MLRLRNRTSELETSNASLEEELRSLDEDRADIIAYLKKNLLTKTEHMTELQERLDGLRQVRILLVSKEWFPVLADHPRTP